MWAPYTVPPYRKYIIPLGADRKWQLSSGVTWGPARLTCARCRFVTGDGAAEPPALWSAGAQQAGPPAVGVVGYRVNCWQRMRTWADRHRPTRGKTSRISRLPVRKPARRLAASRAAPGRIGFAGTSAASCALSSKAMVSGRRPGTPGW